MFELPKICIGITHLKAAMIIAFMASPQSTYAQTKCAIALVLAQDVSGSVDSTDFHLQKDGLEAAFRDKDVIELIEILPGGISVTLTQWSGHNDQRLAIGWSNIQDATDAYDFADKIKNDKRVRTGSLTAIGKALLHADHLLSSNPAPCHRSIIDISSDGRSNAGPDASLIADTLATKDITINALVILNKDNAKDNTLIRYFEQAIIRGTGSFVQPASTYNDYATAIKQKLLRELTPNLAENNFRQHFATQLTQNLP